MAYLTLIKCWTMAVAVIGIGERVHFQRIVRQSARLGVGATEDEVVHVLGEPILQWDERQGIDRLLFGDRPAQWIYGTVVDLSALSLTAMPLPSAIPIKLRLFATHEDDLVIDWTPEGRVSAMRRPNIDLPDELAKFYEPLWVLTDVARSLHGAGD